MIQNLIKTLVLIVVFAVSGPSSLRAQENIVSGGKTRSMIVYAPKDIKENRPLLISMHGMNQDAGYQRDQAKYADVADTAKFVVVYPNGEGKAWDIGGDKDINFILDIIDEMYKRYKINRSRVYLSGFSMGGMMTYHAANKIADKIAAFAPCSGYPMGGPSTSASRAIPILHVHGTGDDVCVYSNVQNHLNAWVKFNKCNTTPTVSKPKSGPSNTTAEMIRYTGGQNGVEVAHLKLPGKGHWHSNDPAMAMTNVEIWNFVSRWSLVEGPEMTSVSPEDGSFDMDEARDNTFTVNFNKPVVCSSVKASLSNLGTTVNLNLQETGESETLTFSIPEGMGVMEGENTLSIQNIESADGGKGADIKLYYTFGVEEVGEEITTDTIFSDTDWYSQRETIGEGIPKGWIRVNSRSDGTKDEKRNGAKDCGGCRMKYFEEGGDFNAGFYLSAREYDKGELTYGMIGGKLLSMKKGRMIVSFNSIYWNDAAMSQKNTFSVSLANRTSGDVYFSEPSLQPSGCLSENSGQQVKGSQHHEVEVRLPANTLSTLTFAFASGWNGIIISQPTVTRAMTNAQKYKGDFQNKQKEAEALYEKLKNAYGETLPEAVESLGNTIIQYQDFATISPSEYTAATNTLIAAMESISTLDVTGTPSDEDDCESIYTLQGIKVAKALPGAIYIKGGKLVK